MGNYSVVVLDFETTGLSPNCGARVIEIGAVLVRNNKIVDRFQSLMNPGMRISSFIEGYTGITNKMLSVAPPITAVMRKLFSFMSRHHLVAHNASFDQRFLDAELHGIGKQRKREFACSMLISRRLYPEASSHSLEAIVHYKNIKTNGVHHRALADAEMTGTLWIGMVNDIKADYKLRHVPFDLMRQLSQVPKAAVPDFLKRAKV